ncbi:hypothetical protein SDRG_03866 [Saprolegnia diclina VS20]|uniref:TFIIS N-terminal domain-containing protein n=1 Tax=Saprolegnia diclina (strain VS20) TaxID=1156394 RepID=T0S1K5_SAPDV|nr:hypothetical protein SDRG_03866 [Saprolegnia diclina VS20]EQC38908.1 hypothetical protein SDRG_03866 [Saprolegnia diclina VS20]|eukprot:XP_008607732.1 hypothetical protein SDRG_03866 [Saprolegnia diclina VS20]
MQRRNDPEMEATVAELADEVLGLTGVSAPAARKELFNRVGTFFFKLKAEGKGHWWCHGRLPELSAFMLQLVDKRAAGNHIDTWIRESYSQLQQCTDCIDGYHAMLLTLQAELASLYTEESMKLFLRLLVEADVERLKLIWSSNSFVKKQRGQELTMGLYELFMHPRLLRDFRFLKPMHKWIAEKPDEALELCDWHKLKQCPGLYMLLMCPDSVLRAWSATVLSKLGHIELQSTSPLVSVVEEWMYLLENQQYNVSMLELDLASTYDLAAFMDSTQCTRTPTPQVLWAAFDALFQTLEENMLAELLRRFDNLPDLVFTFLQEANPVNPKSPPPVVLVVARCYGVLMKSLRYRLWEHTSYDAATVWDMLHAQCKTTSWREFVVKALLELCDPLLTSLRPPNQDSASEAVRLYFEVRRQLLSFLLHDAPHLYADQSVLRTTVTRVLCDVLQASFDTTRSSLVRPLPGAKPADVGALPETETLDIVTLSHRFWWPLTLHDSPMDERNASCFTSDWMDVLLVTLQTSNVMGLVDAAATTVALVLRKQLYLMRDTWMMHPSRLGDIAWVSDLFTALCSWTDVEKIPLLVHAVLFETVGVAAQLACRPPTDAPAAIEGLEMVQDVLCPYVERMTIETTERGLGNIFRTPIVAQHMTLCLITSHPRLRPCIKRLIMHGGGVANKTYTSFTEPYQNLVSSYMPSFLRGVATTLMYLRVHGLQPTCVKELLLHWTHTFESLPDVLYNCIVKEAAKAKASSSSSIQKPSATSAMDLTRFPLLMHLFLMNALEKLSPSDNEAYGVRVLRFARYMWRLWFVFHGDRHECLDYPANRIILPLLQLAHHPNPTLQRRVVDLCGYITQELGSSDFVFDAKLDTEITAVLTSWSFEDGDAAGLSALRLGLETLLQLKRSVRLAREREAIVIDSDDDDDDGVEIIEEEDLDEVGDDDVVPWYSKEARRQRAKAKKTSSSLGKAKLTKPGIGPSPFKTLVPFARLPKKSMTTTFDRASAAVPRPTDSFYDDVDYEAIRKRREQQASKEGPTSASTKSAKSRTVSVLGYQPAFGGGASSSTVPPSSSAPSPHKEAVKPPKDALPAPVLKMIGTIRHIRSMRKPLHPSSLYPFYRQILLASQVDPRFKTSSSADLAKPSISFLSSIEYGHAFLPLLLEEVQCDIAQGFGGNGPTIGLRLEAETMKENLRVVTFAYLQRPMKRSIRKNDVVRVTSTLNAEIACTGVYVPEDDDKFSKKKGNDDKVRVLLLTASDKEMPVVLLDTLIGGSEWNVRVVGNLTTSAREYLALMAIDFIPLHLRSVVLQPHKYKSTQSTVLGLISDIDTVRDAPSTEADKTLMAHLGILEDLPMKLEDLRVTNIGVIVRKLRKYKGGNDVVQRAAALITKWQKLLDTKDELSKTPLFLPPPVWDQLQTTYNASQLQSVHSILNNYSTGVSLLQGPPGTGKTKTIMGIISGLLAVSLPTPSAVTAPRKAMVVKPALVDFSGASTTSSLPGAVKATSIQQIKNKGMSRQRLEGAMAGRPMFKPRPASGPRTVSVLPIANKGPETNHILICAPSNGAVDELILRLRTDGLVGPDGKPMLVSTPKVHSVSGDDANTISLLRLGSATEDAPLIVKQSCLNDVVRVQVETHPKYQAFQALTRRHTELRDAIKLFHTQAKSGETPTASKKDMTAWHRELSEITGKKRRLQEEVQMLERTTANALLAKANIIACTLSKCGSGDLDDVPRGFDAVIIDEAAQAVETSTLIPLRERVARVIFVGDPKQLPATVKSVEAQDALFNRSMFERLADGGVPRAILRVQYRMHPFLREFPSKAFYNGILSDGPVIATRLHTLGMQVYKHPCYQPFVLYDIESAERDGPGGSKCNSTEAAFGVAMVEHLKATVELVKTKEWSIGFVTPYKEQVMTLRHLVSGKGWSDVEVNTVDGFQGREKDIIIMSCVRTRAVGFLKDVRRLNVALTRARYCCFVLGHARTLCKDPTWKQLVSNAYDRKMYIKAAKKPFEQIWAESEADVALKEQYEKMHAPILAKSKDESSKQTKRKRVKGPDDREPTKKRDDEASENTLPAQEVVVDVA